MGNIEKFDGIAARCDTPERIVVAKRIADKIRDCVKHNGKEKSALDYGCGTGLVGMQLLDDFASLLFVDASNNMVEEVRRKISEQHIQNASAMCCDFTANPPENLNVDYVIMAQTLLHIEEVDLILKTLCGVLARGGHLLIIDFDKNDSITSGDVHNGFEQNQLIDTAIKAGFARADAKTFYRSKNIFMNQDASLFLLDCVK